jgi:hypothetical protein
LKWLKKLQEVEGAARDGGSWKMLNEVDELVVKMEVGILEDRDGQRRRK